MRQSLATIALVVRDYDEAIAWFTDKLGFTLEQDVALAPSKRWVVVAPRSGAGARLLLARADGPKQEARIGTRQADASSSSSKQTISIAIMQR